MSSRTRNQKRRNALWSAALLCWVTISLATIESHPATHHLPPASPATPPCSAPEYRQFDFWIGHWDAFDVDKPNTVVARNRVEHILGDCALLEDYRGKDGSHGESFSIYDTSRKVWHQTWVTNRGKLLVIEGNFQSGEMVLSGADTTSDGKGRRVRGVWKPVADGVRETAVTSADADKSWQPWFDIVFRRHTPRQ